VSRAFLQVWRQPLWRRLAAAFGVVFVADGLAAMSVAAPVAVLGGTESRGGQQHKLFADGP